MEELMKTLERAVDLDGPSIYCMQDYDGNGFSFEVVPRGGKPGFPNQFGYSVLFWREISDQQTICSRWFPAKTSAKHRANQLSQDILTWVSATRTKAKKENPIGYAVYHQTGTKEETFQKKISRWLDYDERFYRYDDILEIVTELINNPHREGYSEQTFYQIRINVRGTIYYLRKIHCCDKLTLTTTDSVPIETVNVGKDSKENMAWIFSAEIADLELYKVVSNGLNCIESPWTKEEYDICDRPDCKFVIKKERIVSEYGIDIGTYADFYTLLDNNGKELCSKPVSYGIQDTSRLFASKIRDILMAKHDNDKNDDSNTTADEVKFVKSNSSYMLKVLSHLDDYNVMGRSPEIYVGFPIHGYSFRVSTSDKSNTIKLSYSISLDENLEYSFKKEKYPGRYMADVMLKCIYRIIKKERMNI